MVIVLIWLSYVALLMRFMWVPALADTSLPSFAGVAQFAFIEFATPDRFGYWILAVGLLIIVVSLMSHRFLKKARQDSRNSEFFQFIPNATWRDLLPQILYSFTALTIGVVSLLIRPNVWFASSCTIFICIRIVHFILQQNYYWNRSFETTAAKTTDMDPMN